MAPKTSIVNNFRSQRCGRPACNTATAISIADGGRETGRKAVINSARPPRLNRLCYPLSRRNRRRRLWHDSKYTHTQIHINRQAGRQAAINAHNSWPKGTKIRSFRNSSDGSADNNNNKKNHTHFTRNTSQPN